MQRRIIRGIIVVDKLMTHGTIHYTISLNRDIGAKIDHPSLCVDYNEFLISARNIIFLAHGLVLGFE